MDNSTPDQDFLSDLGSAPDSESLPDDDPDVVAGMARLKRLRAVEEEIPSAIFRRAEVLGRSQ